MIFLPQGNAQKGKTPNLVCFPELVPEYCRNLMGISKANCFRFLTSPLVTLVEQSSSYRN